MKTVLSAAFAWAIVVHALLDDEPVDAVIDVYPTQEKCVQEMEGQNILGECYEVETIINRQAA
ncbi:DUF1482 family protein [Salmonella enterica subsp. enterica]|nr:DUF1482 family protein [Salmonella enterica subsp. enterica serovar Aba]EAX8473327.1 DUF1482 family protein [Salmonella enterica]